VPDWPADLVKELARRRCVPFLGAGVSRNSVGDHGKRPPLWDDFLEAACGNLGAKAKEAKRYLKQRDLLTAAHIAKNLLGGHDWHELLEEEFSRPKYMPADIHDHIFSLDAPIVCTTNVDRIYEKHVQSKYAGACVVKNYCDDDLARYVRGDLESRLILKVHGSVDNLPKAIFTREEYADAWHGSSRFYELFQAIILTNTVLFIGYGLSDPDVQLVLENGARLFKSSKPHYLVTSSTVSEPVRLLYERNYNIKIVTYNARENHIELSRGLKDLATKVQSQRVDIAAKLLW
jgi:hypothetical protein